MKRLLKNGTVINVFTDSAEKADVLIEDGLIIGIGKYDCADIIEDISGKYVCPGFIDGHIHIESTKLSPYEFAKVCLPHGTTSVITDPHEIANVAGIDGIEYMLECSESLPLKVYVMAPSCVPATQFDESGAVLTAEDIAPLFSHPRVLGLAEMMNYPGVIYGDSSVSEKLRAATGSGVIINGHAPLLSGSELDKYISAGIYDDHECSELNEAMEKLRKGQMIMIREGSAARNLSALMPLFDEPYSRRCMLVTDDKDSADLLGDGHIDSIIRKAVSGGKSVFTAIRMATFQAARHFGLARTGAVAPGYIADILVLDSLEPLSVCDVYTSGRKAVENKKLTDFTAPKINADVWKSVTASVNMPPVTEDSFRITHKNCVCNVIKLIPGQLITKCVKLPIDFENGNGIDVSRDILKLAVIERHKRTGHIGLGFVAGTGIKHGALASSVSHDSHNIVVIGTNECDMVVAAERIRKIGGGLVVCRDGEILAELPLPIGGLMSTKSAGEVAKLSAMLREKALLLGSADGIDPFMHMSFASLPVIPDIKLTTIGLVDVNTQTVVPLFCEE